MSAQVLLLEDLIESERAGPRSHTCPSLEVLVAPNPGSTAHAVRRPLLLLDGVGVPPHTFARGDYAVLFACDSPSFRTL